MSQSRVSQNRVSITDESHVSLKNSVQSEFIIHGCTLSKQLKTAFSQTVKEYDYERWVHLDIKESEKIKAR